MIRKFFEVEGYNEETCVSDLDLVKLVSLLGTQQYAQLFVKMPLNLIPGCMYLLVSSSTLEIVYSQDTERTHEPLKFL